MFWDTSQNWHVGQGRHNLVLCWMHPLLDCKLQASLVGTPRDFPAIAQESRAIVKTLCRILVAKHPIGRFRQFFEGVWWGYGMARDIEQSGLLTSELSEPENWWKSLSPSMEIRGLWIEISDSWQWPVHTTGTIRTPTSWIYHAHFVLWKCSCVPLR